MARPKKYDFIIGESQRPDTYGTPSISYRAGVNEQEGFEVSLKHVYVRWEGTVTWGQVTVLKKIRRTQTFDKDLRFCDWAIDTVNATSIKIGCSVLLWTELDKLYAAKEALRAHMKKVNHVASIKAEAKEGLLG
jgi:hypothetical protein